MNKSVLIFICLFVSTSMAYSGGHIRSDGQGGFWDKDNNHIRSDGQGGFWDKDNNHIRSDGNGGFWR